MTGLSLSLGLGLTFGGPGEPGEPAPWILAAGAWDDLGAWRDGEAWKDAA